jgi:hypothetical protein
MDEGVDRYQKIGWMYGGQMTAWMGAWVNEHWFLFLQISKKLK